MQVIKIDIMVANKPSSTEFFRGSSLFDPVFDRFIESNNTNNKKIFLQGKNVRVQLIATKDCVAKTCSSSEKV